MTSTTLPDTPLSTLRRRLLEHPPWVVIVTIFFGLGWARAAVEKLIDPTWWSGAYLSDFLATHDGLALPWAQTVLDTVIAPNLVAVSLTVMVLQAVVAASLLSGRHLKVGLAIGMAMNVAFMIAGAVNPSIFYLVAQGAVALWLAERADTRIGRSELQLAAFAGLVLVGLALPWARMLHPADAIEDPALVLMTFGGLSALGAWLTLERRALRPVPVAHRAWPPSGG